MSMVRTRGGRDCNPDLLLSAAGPGALQDSLVAINELLYSANRAFMLRHVSPFVKGCL